MDWDKPLGDVAIKPIPPQDIDKNIREYTDVNGSWAWSKINEYLPSSFLLLLASCLPPIHTQEEDKPFWQGSSLGLFSISSAYELITSRSWNVKEDKWKVIWSLPVPQRVRTFQWLTLKNALLTNHKECYGILYIPRIVTFVEE